MDPIAAYRKQQQRMGMDNLDLSVSVLREKHPRWATIFDRIDTSGDDLLQIDEVIKGFRHILGAGSQVPIRQVNKVFDEILLTQNADGVHTPDTDGLDFKYFTVFARTMGIWMQNHPHWEEEEAKAAEEEEKQRLLAEKERLAREGPDIFAVLGLRKSKDVWEAEASKKAALKHAHTEHEALVAARSASKGSVASSDGAGADQLVLRMSQIGNSIIKNVPHGFTQPAVGSSQRVSGSSSGPGASPSNFNEIGTLAQNSIGVRRFASRLQRSRPSIDSNASMASAEPEEEAPVESPAKKIRDMWSRFSLTSASAKGSRRLTDVRQIHLPDYLPQIRVLGKRNAGCTSLRFSADGSQLAGAFFDGGVRIFDVDRAVQAHCLNLSKFKGGSVKSVEEMARDLPGSYDFDADDDVDLQAIMKQWDPITNIKWQPAGDGSLNLLASVDTKGILATWQVPRCMENRPSRCLSEVDTGTSLTAVSWTCDGNSIAVAGEEKVIKIYDVQMEMGKLSLTAGRDLGKSISWHGNCTGHALRIMSLCGHPTNPDVLVSGGLDHQLLIWDFRASIEPQGHIAGPELAGDAIDVSKDGNTILCGNHRSRNPLEIYDLRMDEEARPTVSYQWRGDEDASEGGGRWTTCLPLSVCWDDWENKTVVAAGENENLGRVYERSDNPDEPLRVLGTVCGKDRSFWSSAISTEGRSVAFGSSDGAVCLVNLTQN